MESIKLFLILSLLSVSLFAKEKVIGRMYFNDFMGHVHISPSKTSGSKTTIQCAHNVKILEQDEKYDTGNWFYVMVGEDKGYINSQFLQTDRPNCFQEKYPRFYQKLNLDLTDLYYFGRLNDHYQRAVTRAK